MSLISRIKSLFVIFAFSAFVAGQTCYYPDKNTVSTDVPCSTTGPSSSCCPANSFCMSNGLCFDGSLLSRGSCSDKTWQSAACPAICNSVNVSSSAFVIPCSEQTFTCGLDPTTCGAANSTFQLASGSQIVLRPDQVVALISAESASAANSTSAAAAAASASASKAICDSSGQPLFPSSTVLAVGLGLGFPLAIACVALILMYRHQHRRTKPPPRIVHTPRKELSTPALSRPISTRPSFNSTGRDHTPQAVYPEATTNEPLPKTLVDRYIKKLQDMRRTSAHEMDEDRGVLRYELGTSPPDKERDAEMDMEMEMAEMAEVEGSHPEGSLAGHHEDELQ